jgi:hypothetical protein
MNLVIIVATSCFILGLCLFGLIKLIEYRFRLMRSHNPGDIKKIVANRGLELALAILCIGCILVLVLAGYIHFEQL